MTRHHRWLQRAQAQLKSDSSVGSYVRVYGNVRSFDKKKSMQAYSIKPVTDFNEVRNCFDAHTLGCIRTVRS